MGDQLPFRWQPYRELHKPRRPLWVDLVVGMAAGAAVVIILLTGAMLVQQQLDSATDQLKDELDAINDRLEELETPAPDGPGS